MINRNNKSAGGEVRLGNLHKRTRVIASAVEALESRRLLSSTFSPAFIVDDHAISGGVQKFATGSSPSYFTPSLLRKAYGADQVSFSGVTGDGSGQTIAIVDAYNAPTIRQDLTTFDNIYGLANPTLTIVGQNGSSTLPSNDPSGAGNSWAVETSLDVEWAHVMAPKANILLVLAKDPSDNLYTAVDTARNWPGVTSVSMSWGSDEYYTDPSYNYHFLTPSGHAGVTFFASSGDEGAYSVTGSGAKIPEYPAASPNVVSVGGTTLTTQSDGTYVSEAGWGHGTTSYSDGGGGGGISLYESQPTWQRGISSASTSKRLVPDVSMDADPNSGVPVIDTYDFGNSVYRVGGTSLASPLWAGVMALVNQGRSKQGLSSMDGSTQTLPTIYSLKNSLHDVTTGNNGYAAGTGYDLVTGRGTPIVNLLVNELGGLSSTQGTAVAPTIGSFAISPASVTVGASYSLTASNVAGTNISGVQFYRDSNGVAGLQTGTGGDTLIGSGAQSGSTWSLSASTAGYAANTYTYFAVATGSAGTATSSAALTVTAATPATPTIGSFVANPAALHVGSSTTLTASNVSGGGTATISGVQFYRESNGISGLQTGTGGDTFAGSGTANGSTWSLVTGTTGFKVATYTYYARATNSLGATATSSTKLAVTSSPTIGSFTISPTSVVAGASATLTAVNVAETGGTIASVVFYRESNGVSGLQTGTGGDLLLGTGTNSGSNWSLSTSTSGLTAGTYTYFALATDGKNAKVSKSATLQVTASTTAVKTTAFRSASFHASVFASRAAIASLGKSLLDGSDDVLTLI